MCCASLQNFAFSAVVESVGKPPAGAACDPVCRTCDFCTKKRYKARRREVDKCILRTFFIYPSISLLSARESAEASLPNQDLSLIPESYGSLHVEAINHRSSRPIWRRIHVSAAESRPAAQLQ